MCTIGVLLLLAFAVQTYAPDGEEEMGKKRSVKKNETDVEAGEPEVAADSGASPTSDDRRRHDRDDHHRRRSREFEKDAKRQEETQKEVLKEMQQRLTALEKHQDVMGRWVGTSIKFNVSKLPEQQDIAARRLAKMDERLARLEEQDTELAQLEEKQAQIQAWIGRVERALAQPFGATDTLKISEPMRRDDGNVLKQETMRVSEPMRRDDGNVLKQELMHEDEKDAWKEEESWILKEERSINLKAPSTEGESSNLNAPLTGEDSLNLNAPLPGGDVLNLNAPLPGGDSLNLNAPLTGPETQSMSLFVQQTHDSVSLFATVVIGLVTSSGVAFTVLLFRRIASNTSRLGEASLLDADLRRNCS